jgi:hypothetical protein
VDFAFNDAEPHHRLRRRSAQIRATDAVGVDLVGQRVGRLSRRAQRRGVDDAEGLEEGVGDVDRHEIQNMVMKTNRRNPLRRIAA